MTFNSGLYRMLIYRVVEKIVMGADFDTLKIQLRRLNLFSREKWRLLLLQGGSWVATVGSFLSNQVSDFHISFHLIVAVSFCVLMFFFFFP